MKPRPALELDPAKYDALLNRSDLSPDQRDALMQALWGIMMEFVALGYGIHPIQQAKPGCEQLDENVLNTANSDDDMVYLDQSLITDMTDEPAHLLPAPHTDSMRKETL